MPVPGARSRSVWHHLKLHTHSNDNGYQWRIGFELLDQGSHFHHVDGKIKFTWWEIHRPNTIILDFFTRDRDGLFFLLFFMCDLFIYICSGNGLLLTIFLLLKYTTLPLALQKPKYIVNIWGWQLKDVWYLVHIKMQLIQGNSLAVNSTYEGSSDTLCMWHVAILFLAESYISIILLITMHFYSANYLFQTSQSLHWFWLNHELI